MSDDSRFTDEAFEVVTDKEKIEELRQKAKDLKAKAQESKPDSKRIS
jgi:hypothetical protein